MIHFLQQIIQPSNVLMLFVFLYAISVHIYPGFVSNDGQVHVYGIWSWLWTILAILALIAWCFGVFG